MGVSGSGRGVILIVTIAVALAMAASTDNDLTAQSQPPGPSVAVTTPANGSTVSGTTTVSATASSDAVGVWFKVDGLDLFGNFKFTTLDGTPPTVLITAPAAGATVSQTATITATATDNVGVAGVQFKVDGTNIGGEDTTAPYAASWDTTTASAGTHSLTAVARDAAGNQKTSAALTVTVSNTTADTTAPTVSVTAPAAGATVAGTTTVTANASDNVAVVGVQFKLDGANLGTEDLAAPYSVSWNTTGAANGAHTLTAVARDAAGNTKTSAGIGVTVANDTTPPVFSTVLASSISPSAATITWTTNEVSDSQVEYGPTSLYGSSSALNGSLVVAHTTTLSALAASTLYHYRVRSRDAAGNLGISSDFTFTTLEGTPPTVSITAPAAGATVAGTTTVSANATDNVGVAGVQFKLDGNNLAAEIVTAPYSFAWNTQGSRDLVFAVTKIAVGGVAISPGTGFTKRLTISCPTCTNEDTVTEDKVESTPGTVAGTFTFSAPAHYLAQMAAFKAAATPSYVQGAAATTNTGSTTIARSFSAPVAAGNLLVAALAWQTNAAVSVSDNLGNLYSVATTGYDTVNNQSVAIVYAANAKAGVTTVTASFGAATPSVQRLEIHEYSGVVTTNPLDATATNIGDGTTAANAVTSGSNTTSVTSAVANGTHTLSAQARDAAGNSATSAAVTVTVNNTAPDTTPPTISAVAASGLTGSAATISWTTNEASDSQVDYGPTTGYGSSSAVNATLLTAHTTALTGLTSGTLYHYRVRSRDAAGNLAVSGDFTFTTVDTVGPTVAITAPAAGATVSLTTTVTATASDNIGVVGVQFKLDGANLGGEDTTAPYSAAWNTTTASPGLHTLTAVARDAAGNSTTSATITVTVANGTVSLNLAWDPSTDLSATGYKLYIGTATGVYSQSINAGNVTTYTVTGLNAGTVYYFVVTAYDANGVESDFSNEVNWSG